MISNSVVDCRTNGYVDIAVGNALYILQENRTTVEVYDRITMNFNRQFQVDSLIAKQRRHLNHTEQTRILSMIAINSGNASLLLGTSTGEILIIPDRLLVSKQEIKVNR